jgi:YesN/AraC family two-component response regulator
MQDASRKGRLVGKPHVRGIEHPMSTLSFEQIQAMRDERAKGMKLKDLSASYGISIAAISKIVRKEMRVNA